MALKIMNASVRESTLVIEFNDPSTKNSFSLAAARELRELLKQFTDSVESLIFFNTGRVFCSGGNLDHYASLATSEEAHVLNREIADVLEELANFKVPTVAVVRGDCFGGGVELLSAFDVVYSAPHVFFGLWQRRVGLGFGWGGGQRLDQRLGSRMTSKLALEARSIGAQEALRFGLVDRVLPDATLMSSALNAALRLSELPKNPVEALKAHRRASSESERESFESLWLNEEHETALLSRRKN